MNAQTDKWHVWRPTENTTLNFCEEYDIHLKDKSEFMNAFNFREFKRIPKTKHYGVYLFGKMHLANNSMGEPSNWLVPLYVGCSGNVRGRIQNHRNTKEWWNEVEFIWISFYQSKECALNIETMLINNIRPVHNKQVIRQKPKRVEPRFAVVDGLELLAKARFITDIYHEMMVLNNEI